MANDEPDAELLAVLAAGVRIMALRTLADADAANDVVQETLARALPRIRDLRYGSRDRLGAYLRGIAHHVITDVLRARGKASLVTLSEADEVAGASNALDDVVAEEQRTHLQAAFDHLDEPDQELLRLAFVEGLGSAQLARTLGEPADRIRKRRSRALERLRRAFFGIAHDPSQLAPRSDYDVEVVSRAATRGR